MKKYFLIIIMIVTALATHAQVKKHYLQFGLGLFLNEDGLESLTGTGGVEYQRNFKRKDLSFWTYHLGIGALYSLKDNGGLPYVQTGLEKSISTNRKNYFHFGFSLIYYFPELHVGYTYVPPNSKKGMFKLYLSDTLIDGDHLVRLGIGYSLSLN